MPSANDYARLATQASQMAIEIKPHAADPDAENLKLAQFYLNRAAVPLRAAADAKAGREKASA